MHQSIFSGLTLLMVANFCAADSTDGHTTTYLGCYKDDRMARIFPYFVETSFRSQTTEGCAANCRQIGFSYSGTQSGWECFCGESAPASPARVGDSECQSPCGGSKSEKCGGHWRMSVYKTTNKRSCPPGWHNGTGDNANCYFYLKGVRVTWQEARDACQVLRQGSFLAEPKDRDQFDYVTSLMDGQNPNVAFVSAHLGAAKDEKSPWLWEEEKDKVSDDFWCPRQPDNFGGEEKCLQLVKTPGRRWCFNDRPCSTVQPFVCEMPPAEHDHVWLEPDNSCFEDVHNGAALANCLLLQWQERLLLYVVIPVNCVLFSVVAIALFLICRCMQDETLCERLRGFFKKEVRGSFDLNHVGV